MSKKSIFAREHEIMSKKLILCQNVEKVDFGQKNVEKIGFGKNDKKSILDQKCRKIPCLVQNTLISNYNFSTQNFYNWQTFVSTIEMVFCYFSQCVFINTVMTMVLIKMVHTCNDRTMVLVKCAQTWILRPLQCRTSLNMPRIDML